MANKHAYGTYDDYIKLKSDTDKQSYKDEHKITNIGLLAASWLCNAVSIYLAFFFVKNLIANIFTETNDSQFINIIIIVFLSFFELIKRHIFKLFSKEVIRNEFKVFNKKLFTFNFSVLLIVSVSFFLSLSGAKNMMNKDIIITQKTENTINIKTDSLNNYYMNTFIKPLQDENKALNIQNDTYMSATQNQTRMTSKYTNLIEQNNIKINNIVIRIKEYEKERDAKLIEFKNNQSAKLTTAKVENNSNVVIFVCISTVLELLIMIGVYFSTYYKFRIKKDYESNILNTPKYVRWKMYNDLAEIIFEGIDINDCIPSVNEIKEIANINNMRLNNRDIENFGKMMNFIRAIERRSNKRILIMPIDKIQETLKNYYKIN